jgi:nucleotide-binding universal stress UspA family protein
VLVAVDFSRASIQAVRTALNLVEPGATVYLAYVRPGSDAPCPEIEGQRALNLCQQGAAAAFSALQRILQVPPGVVVESLVAEGNVVEELFALAARLDADLVAAGSHRHNGVGSFMTGGVAMNLLRAARYSILITPPQSFINQHTLVGEMKLEVA